MTTESIVGRKPWTVRIEAPSASGPAGLSNPGERDGRSGSARQHVGTVEEDQIVAQGVPERFRPQAELPKQLFRKLASPTKYPGSGTDRSCRSRAPSSRWRRVDREQAVDRDLPVRENSSKRPAPFFCVASGRRSGRQVSGILKNSDAVFFPLPVCRGRGPE